MVAELYSFAQWRFMNKAQLEAELSRLRDENSDLRRIIKQLEKLNQQAFKRQHEAERKLNALYASR